MIFIISLSLKTNQNLTVFDREQHERALLELDERVIKSEYMRFFGKGFNQHVFVIRIKFESLTEAENWVKNHHFVIRNMCERVRIEPLLKVIK